VIEERREQRERERTSCGILAIYLSACIDQQTAIFIHIIYLAGSYILHMMENNQLCRIYIYVRVQKLWKLFSDR
jgi:hypothetical protein